MNKHFLPFIALILASSIWGANNTVMKITLLSVPLFLLAFIRFGAASVLLLPFVVKKLRVKRQDWGRLLLCGLCGVTLNIAFFFSGIKLTTALNAGIIVSSTPIFTLLFANIFLKEKITYKLLAGSALGIAGIIVIIGRDILYNGLSLSPVGDLLMLAATLSFVAYEILSKRLFKTYNSSTITYYSFLIGALTFLPLAFFELINNPVWFTYLTATSFFGIGYGILCASLLAYSFWEWGLSKIEASRVGFFFYLDPVVSTIVAVLVLSEKITMPFVLGSLLIFAGLFLAEGRLPYHSAHQHIRRS